MMDPTKWTYAGATVANGLAMIDTTGGALTGFLLYDMQEKPNECYVTARIATATPNALASVALVDPCGGTGWRTSYDATNGVTAMPPPAQPATFNKLPYLGIAVHAGKVYFLAADATSATSSWTLIGIDTPGPTTPIPFLLGLGSNDGTDAKVSFADLNAKPVHLTDVP